MDSEEASEEMSVNWTTSGTMPNTGDAERPAFTGSGRAGVGKAAEVGVMFAVGVAPLPNTDYGTPIDLIR
jgi:hypothetical protein